MHSRAEARIDRVVPMVSGTDSVLRAVGAVMHGVALVSIALLLWHFLTPDRARSDVVRVSSGGGLDASIAALVTAPSNSVTVQLLVAPHARSRATLRALRASGHTVTLSADSAPAPLAVSIEEEWHALGGVRIQTVSSGSVSAKLADAAGHMDSLTLTATGAEIRPGPVQGALHVSTLAARASASPLTARAPDVARVLVVGAATWESRFLIAALEEGGWPVDAAVSLSPKVTITQGALRTPSRERHSIVVVLPGAPASAVAALPDFVRRGGGLVIVGAAARSGGLATLRAGTAGAATEGEVGAEASADARRGLELTPIAALASDAVVLERQHGKVAIAARRVGAGRVVQVGYENSWLWRMAGNDAAPAAHRRWWSTILSGVVPQTAPIRRTQLNPGHDTLDAAPIAALARDLGLPAIRPAKVATVSQSFMASLDPRWLLSLAVLSLVMSWTMRRWRGLA